jgi:predicted nuclease with TOPRIM domain
MSDSRADLMLDMLRAIRTELGEIRADLGEVKEWLGILEVQYASLSRPVDRIGDDMEQLQRRLGLIEA